LQAAAVHFVPFIDALHRRHKARNRRYHGRRSGLVLLTFEDEKTPVVIKKKTSIELYELRDAKFLDELHHPIVNNWLHDYPSAPRV